MIYLSVHNSYTSYKTQPLSLPHLGRESLLPPCSTPLFSPEVSQDGGGSPVTVLLSKFGSSGNRSQRLGPSCRAEVHREVVKSSGWPSSSTQLEQADSVR